MHPSIHGNTQPWHIPSMTVESHEEVDKISADIQCHAVRLRQLILTCRFEWQLSGVTKTAAFVMPLKH